MKQKNNLYNFKSLFIIIPFLVFSSCNYFGINMASGISAIKIYDFPFSKDSVQSAFDALINADTNISALDADEDTSKPASIAYFRVLIKKVPTYSFLFRFYEDETYWKSHPDNSEIFIVAIRKGNDKWKKDEALNKTEKKEAIDFFEKNFIVPLNKRLKPAK